VTDAPETCYTKTADGVHLAYQAFGAGPVDLVVLPGGFNLEVEWERPSVARFFRRLATFSRVIRFNMRGEGQSDPVAPRDWQTLEQRAEDMLTVLDAVGSERPALLGGVFGGHMMIFFAAAHPERASALVLFGTAARFGWAPDYPWGLTSAEREAAAASAEGQWEHGAGLARRLAPSLAHDAGFVDWVARLHRQSYSPGAARAAAEMTLATDLRDLLPLIRVPTLVMCRSKSFAGSEHARYLAGHIPGAKVVELPGDEIVMYLGDVDAVVDEVEEFLTGSRHVPEADRVLATVLFTDIVASTQRAAEFGDRRWRDLLDAHDDVVRRQLDRFRAGRSTPWATASSPPSTAPGGPSCARAPSETPFGPWASTSGPACTPERSSGAAMTWPGWPSTSAPESPPSPGPAKSWSPGPYLRWSPVPASSSQTGASTS
jgi:pimeloyl-ACP methyl ester carboxylesterase